MKRHILAVIAILLGACAMFATPPKKEVPLKVDGDTVLVLKSLPCTVTAPPGADLYSWSLPAGVTGTALDNVLTITAAPQGASTINLTTITFLITVDKDFKVTKTKVTDKGCVVITNGMQPPPPPVPPTPTDPLAAKFQIGYNADADADRATSLAFLQSAYKGMAAQAGAKSDLKTNADFVKWMKAVVEAPGVGLTADKVKSLRTAIGAELAANWGTATKPLAAADAASELSRVSNALSGVK